MVETLFCNVHELEIDLFFFLFLRKKEVKAKNGRRKEESFQFGEFTPSLIRNLLRMSPFRRSKFDKLETNHFGNPGHRPLS